MAVCFATLHQFSQDENCFIDGTPMGFGEEEHISGKEMHFSGWDVMPNECGSIHDTVSESLDSETLRKRKAGNQKLASHSRWTGYSPDECYSPHSPLEDPNAKWQQLPNNTPSSEEKVAQWMSFEEIEEMQAQNEEKPILVPNSVFGQVQDRRPRGRRSRSIILRFEEEQRQRNQVEESFMYQAAHNQPHIATLAIQDSRTKRRKNMDSTAHNVGIEKPLPELPRKGSLADSLGGFIYEHYSSSEEIMIGHQVQAEQHHSSSEEQHSVFLDQPLSQQHYSPLLPEKIYLDVSLQESINEEQQPTMEGILSPISGILSPISIKSRNIISLFPSPSQLFRQYGGGQDTEQAQLPTTPEPRTSVDDALRKLEHADEDNEQIVPQDRVKSDDVGMDLMRKTLGFASDEKLIPKVSVEQLETVLRQPSPVGRRERPRPAPIDMSAISEANRTHQRQLEILSEIKKRDSGVADCNTPEEHILYSESPSELIPPPLSLSFTSDAVDLQVMSPMEKLEGGHDRFSRHQKFFDNRPLSRCLDGGGVDKATQDLYEQLLEETRVYEALQSAHKHEQRAFWENVRSELDVDDEVEEVEAPAPLKLVTKISGIPIRGKQLKVVVHSPDESPLLGRGQQGWKSYY